MTSHPLKLAVGGPVQAKQGTYLSRPADEMLLSACRESRFAYVLACRQIGKSSLMFETSRKLSQAGVKTALIDLNSIGRDAEADAWYFSLVDELAHRLKLEVDVQAWWEGRPRLSTRNQRLLQFLQEVVLRKIAEPIVIFVDEIDMTLGLEFTDDFFAAIRSVHNDRAQYPAYQRLTFVLLGVATPDELIKDHTRTPFNIGQAIPLRDFSQEECEPFRLELAARYPRQGQLYFDQIYHWTGGHPYLIQKLCQAVMNAAAEGPDKEDPGLVNRLVRDLFLAAEARTEDNLQFVQNRVTGDPFAQEMLKIYRQALEKEQPVQDNEQSPPINRLKLYGLVLTRKGKLEVRNKLYGQVFDMSWANEMLRLSSTSFRLGLPKNYRVIQELGQGGFSTVYLTQLRDSDRSQSIALKVLRREAVNEGHQLKRFKQEARTVEKLDHPNIIHIYETGGDDKNTFFIAMEYIPSGTVRHRLKTGRLPREEAVHIVKRISSALTYAHDHGVIHRDIKPGNILLDTSHEPVRPVLTDFGLIKLLSTDELSRIESTAVLGTFDYMAPEQWRRQPPTPATDVYALAITFFEMLSGQRPFEAESPFELMNKHTGEPLPMLSELTPEVGPYFDDVLRKAAAKDPADRYPSMAEFIQAIEAANEKAEQIERIDQENKAAMAVDAVAGYIQTGRYDPGRALAMIEAALEMYPDYVQALRLRGKIYLDHNQIEKALLDFEQAFRQAGGPGSEVGLEYLEALSQVAGRLWRQQLYSDAVQHYDTIRQIVVGDEPKSSRIQEIWTEARSRLIDYHHHEGDVAYAWGEPDDMDGAIIVLNRMIKALETLGADNEWRNLQDKRIKLQIIRYEDAIREAEQGIEELSSKGSTIRFGKEEIFQYYQTIDEAYRNLLEIDPDNEQWQQARRKRLQECAQSRFVFARRALAKFDPDYEAALRHYEAVQEIEQTKYSDLAKELNLNLEEKISELRAKVNYDGKYGEVLRFIENEEYAAALERLDQEFIQTGNYNHRDVARWLWGLVYARQHDGNFPPEWETATGLESLVKYLVHSERSRINQLKNRVEAWSHTHIFKTVDRERRQLDDYDQQLKDLDDLLDEAVGGGKIEIPGYRDHLNNFRTLADQIQHQRQVIRELDVNEIAQKFEGWLQRVEEIEALLKTGDPVKDVPQFLSRIGVVQQAIEKDATYEMLQKLVAANAEIGQTVDALESDIRGQIARLLIEEVGQREEEFSRLRDKLGSTQDELHQMHIHTTQLQSDLAGAREMMANIQTREQSLRQQLQKPGRYHIINKYVIPFSLLLAFLAGGIVAPRLKAGAGLSIVSWFALGLLIIYFVYYVWVYYLSPPYTE